MIPADVLIEAYCRGAFPMADPEDGTIEWFTADPRGIIPLDGFNIPERLRRELRKRPFQITVDRCFETVMRACSERPDSWISEEMVAS